MRERDKRRTHLIVVVAVICNPKEGFEMQGGEVTPGDQERETEKGRRDKAPERDGAKELPGSPVE